MVDPDICVPAFRKLLDACDFHLLTAPTYSDLGTTGL
jgi:hypothetical protein